MFRVNSTPTVNLICLPQYSAEHIPRVMYHEPAMQHVLHELHSNVGGNADNAGGGCSKLLRQRSSSFFIRPLKHDTLYRRLRRQTPNNLIRKPRLTSTGKNKPTTRVSSSGEKSFHTVEMISLQSGQDTSASLRNRRAWGAEMMGPRVSV